MRDETAEAILEINNIRNTFHLTKSREDIDVEIAKVEKAFELLYIIIKGSPRAISQKNKR